MQLTLACFHEINTVCLDIFSADHQYEANLAMLGKIYDKVTDNFKDMDWIHKNKFIKASTIRPQSIHANQLERPSTI
ncbi:MAG: hypothetical protein WKF66_13785 [Pedobacter sp.]